MKTKPILTQLPPSFNRKFIKRLLYRWVIIFILLALATCFVFIQLDVQTLSPTSWRNADSSVIISILGLPAIFVASLIVALLHTETDRKKNYPPIYWFSYFILGIIFLGINYFSYRYYINYTIQRDQNFRQKLEQEVKENNNPNYEMLADMYQNGWGGSQDVHKAAELYQKACNETSVNSLAISPCKKAKNYKKLRILLKGSNDPYDMATLAMIYKLGLGGSQDLAKAQQLYDKACPDRNDFICKNYQPFK